MSYKLKFLPKALKEWEKLDNSIKEQLKKKLKERLENPYVKGDKLSGYDSVYKIKLRKLGYRLVYEVIENELVIIVITVGKREGGRVYKGLR